MYKIDVKDSKIIRELEINSRQSTSQISRKIGCSKEFTKYRISRLFEKKIISKTFAVIDFGKIGWTTYRIYFKLNNIDLEKEQEIFNYIKQNPAVQWIALCDGTWDIVIRMGFSNALELNETISEWLSKYGRFIDSKEITIATHHSWQPATYINKNYKPLRSQLHPLEINKHINIDKKDFIILKHLQENARVSLLDIAKECKLSANSVSERIKKLEKDKIIWRYTAYVNTSLAGYQHFKVFFQLHFITTEKINTFLSFCINHANIFTVVKTIGAWDLEIDLAAKDNKEFHKIMRDFTKHFSQVIKQYQSVLVFQDFTCNPFKECKLLMLNNKKGAK